MKLFADHRFKTGALIALAGVWMALIIWGEVNATNGVAICYSRYCVIRCSE